MNLRVCFIYPCSRTIKYTLVHSLVQECKNQGLTVYELNTIDETNSYNPDAVLNIYESIRSQLDLTIVLDLGYLDDERIYYANNNHPIVLLAGDNPQSYDLPVLTKLKKNLPFPKPLLNSFFGTFLGHKRLCRNYSHVLTSDKECAELYRRQGVKSIWLPYWADSTVYNKHNYICFSRIYDVVTVMNPRPNRLKTMKTLENSSTFSYSNRVNLFQRQAADHYASGRIVLNKSNYGEFTMRIPEGMAVGSMVITDFISPNKGLYELFLPGRDLETYASTHELIDKLDFYTKHPHFTQKIAENGYKKIEANHFEANRMSTITNFVLND